MRRARIVLAAALACAALGLGALAPDAAAHPGQLSPKDGCHKHKAAGERHWHEPGTAQRGGECVKRDGIGYRVIEREVEVEVEGPALTPWRLCPVAWAALEADIDSLWAPTLQARASALMGCLRGAHPKRE